MSAVGKHHYIPSLVSPPGGHSGGYEKGNSRSGFTRRVSLGQATLPGGLIRPELENCGEANSLVAPIHPKAPTPSWRRLVEPGPSGAAPSSAWRIQVTSRSSGSNSKVPERPPPPRAPHPHTPEAPTSSRRRSAAKPWSEAPASAGGVRASGRPEVSRLASYERGCDRRYTCLSLSLDVCVYTCVVDSDTCPRSSLTAMRSAPASRRCVAKL